ncbi:MAG TPA: hypothetical protein VGC69_05825 [Bordetella sp.]
MAENPFGDTDEQKAERRSYLLLIAASKDNAALVQQYHKNIQAHVDEKASPLWVDSKGIGILISTHLVAAEIWREMFQTKDAIKEADTRDILIVEIGQDWAARRDAKTEHWLSTHVGTPRPAAPHERVRRR